MEAFLSIVETLGFPIACVIALAVFAWKMINTINEQQKEREDKLYTEIGECRVINQQAIDTIAKYAEKLDNIQADIGEIKTDITVIKTKIE